MSSRLPTLVYFWARSLLVVFFLLSSATVAHATKFWKNSVPSGNWSSGTNWSAAGPSGADVGGVPGLNEPVRIYNTNGAAHTVTLDISPPTLGLLSIDLPAAGTLTNTLSLTTNNNLTAAGIYVGGHNGSGFTAGNGVLTQSAGTITTSPGNDLYIALGAGSSGVYNLSGGALNANLSTVVGSGGTGTFNHSGGTHTLITEAIGGALLVGYLGGSNGTYNLSGTGQLIADKNEIIGVDGVGQFFQTGGANTVSGSFVLHLGLNSGSQGTYNLSAGSLVVNNHQFIGYAGVGQFNQSGGSNTVPNLIIADQVTGQGAYAISGGTLTVGSNAQVGVLGTASMNITGTGSVNIAGDLGINNSSNVTLNGGTLRFNTITNPTRLIFQSGTLQLSGNRDLGFDAITNQFFGTNTTIPSGKRLVVEGDTTLYAGNATINGGGLTSLGMLRVGYADSAGATLNITNGATVTSGYTRVGEGAFGDNSTLVPGVVNVSGSGSTWNSAFLEIGRNGRGALNITGGATVASTGVVMGFSNIGGDSSYDTLVVSGPGSSLTSGNDLYVGYNDEASVTIENGGSVYVFDELYLAYDARVTIDGGTLRFNNFTRLDNGNPEDLGKFIYNAGTIQFGGNRNIGGDAVLQELYGVAPVIPLGKGLTVEGAATLTKPLKIDGGTFKTNGLSVGAGGSLLFQSGALEISGGSITGLAQLNIPTNGEFRAVGNHTVRVAGAVGSTITPTGLLILGDFNAVNGFYTNGTVNVGANTLALTDANDAVFDSAALVTLGGSGPGQLDALNGLTLNFGGNITGYGEVYTSNAIFTPLINNGHITGASAAQRITLPGYVKGVGTFDNVNFTGTFAPGLSPTSLVVGNVGFSNSSLLVMELGGTSPGSGYDQILSSGALGFDGTLQLALINGFAPAAGQSFNLFDWANVSGTFDSLTLPTLGAGLSWDTSQLYSAGLLSVSTSIPGDFDLDGDVDGRDFLAWQRGGSPNPFSAGDLGDWQGNYGVGGLATTTAATTLTDNGVSPVPEPASLGLLLGLMTTILGGRPFKK
ncbi:MAG: hypothetical protein SH868_15390 [Bythopirellula sp.]|nr:hypothetical protein [Bythopirellula sp.]